jgi:hypothetical protein
MPGSLKRMVRHHVNNTKNMNEQTQQLIEKLATKLGATAEHLWGVLVRQAPISSATAAIAICIYAAVMVWGYRLVREKTKDEGDWNDHCGSIALPWIIWSVGMLFLVIVLCSSLSNIVAGFVNPEYWALKEILSK